MKHALALIVSLCLVFVANAGADDSVQIKGKYNVIGDLNNLKDVKQIEMIEFFNYSCGHCYKFLTTSKRLHKKFKGKLFHKKYPIYFAGNAHQNAFPAMAFYIADQVGMEKNFTQDLFDTNFQLNINVFQPRTIKMLAKSHGIEKEMTEGMQSEEIKNKVNKAMALANHYKMQYTPTIIINKTLKVDPSLTEGSVEKMTDNLEVIFNDLLNR